MWVFKNGLGGNTAPRLKGDYRFVEVFVLHGDQGDAYYLNKLLGLRFGATPDELNGIKIETVKMSRPMWLEKYRQERVCYEIFPVGRGLWKEVLWDSGMEMLEEVFRKGFEEREDPEKPEKVMVKIDGKDVEKNRQDLIDNGWIYVLFTDQWYSPADIVRLDLKFKKNGDVKLSSLPIERDKFGIPIPRVVVEKVRPNGTSYKQAIKVEKPVEVKKEPLKVKDFVKEEGIGGVVQWRNDIRGVTFNQEQMDELKKNEEIAAKYQRLQELYGEDNTSKPPKNVKWKEGRPIQINRKTRRRKRV